MSVFKECDTPQVLDSHNTTATEGSCTNEPSNEPQKLCVDEVQSGSDMDSSSVVSDNSTLAKAENIDNSRISCKSSLKRIWPWLLGAAVAIATILVFVLTQKSPVEKLNEYIQNNGELICPLSSRQVKYLKVSDKNTYISFWSVGIFMHTISLYIF